MEQHRQDNEPEMDNHEVGRVLALASDPRLPEGASARLLARLQAEPQESPSVILFRPRARRGDGVFRYAAAVPLAASLALGIWLGARGTLDSVLPATLIGDVAANSYDETIDELGGVGEADTFAEEQTT